MGVELVRACNDSNQSRFPSVSAWDRSGFLLWHAMLEWRRKVTLALSQLDITYVQFSLLASVSYLNHYGDPPSQAELAEHTGMDVMMTSQVLRSLERASLVKRATDKNDARIRRVTPTSRGRDVTVLAVRLVEDLDGKIFGPIKDIDRFKNLLRQLADRDVNGRRMSVK